MPFRHQEMSRMDRMRCAVQARASDTAQTFSGAAHTLSGAATTAAGAAQGAARTAAASAAGRAQDAASLMADRATTAAHGMADRTNQAAHTMADRTTTATSTMTTRARPLTTEAAQRTTAAWHILRHGTPRSPMTRMASALPVSAVTTAARRSKAPMTLMILGAAGAAGILAWRRSHADRESVWILEDDSDIEPVGRWHEGDSPADMHDDLDDRTDRPSRMSRSRDAKHSKDGSDANQGTGMDSHPGPTTDRKDSPANRWP